tara:strand:+ start:19 stop:528 length:510 start_codon:yes stop_codon:yes gene_type:complete
MSDPNIAEAARAARALIKQFRAILTVGDALDKIDHLENYMAEAETLTAAARAKLVEVQGKVSEAEQLVVEAEDREAKADEKRSAVAADVEGILASAKAEGEAIVNDAAKVARAETAARADDFAAKKDQYDTAIADAAAELKSTEDATEDAAAELAHIASERAALVAKLS